jgi:hypothetical protein
MGFEGEATKRRAASRWQGLPVVAASAVAPLIVLHVGTHLGGEEAPEARALSIGHWIVWAVLALPPFAATVAGLVVFRPPRARSVFVSCLASLIAYPLSAAFWFLAIMAGAPAMSRLGAPLAVLGAALAAVLSVTAFLALFAGGGVVGFTAVGGIYGLFRPPRPGRQFWVRRRVDGSDGLYVDRARPAGQGFRWLGAAVGTAGIVLPFWFSNVSDFLSVIPFYFLFPGAWLSAVCVVLILRKLAQPRP